MTASDASVVSLLLRFATARLFLAAGVLRVVLIAFASWQDAALPVRYTDADYFVFRDAAAHVVAGASPYARATFRYPPLVAVLLAPGEALGVGAVWGKLLFCGADLVAGALLVALLHARGADARGARRAAALFLLSPLAAITSSRGSADSLTAVLVLAALAAVDAYKPALAGVALGLAVYARIYPVIYVVPVVISLAAAARGRGGGGGGACGAASRIGRFAVAGAATALLAFGAGFAVYGWDTIAEAYLFHVTRTDARHNFSPFWLATYLGGGLRGSAAAPWALGAATVIGALSAARSLPLAALLSTLAFVSLNRVVTAQYFNWWLVLLPLAVPRSRLSAGGALSVAALWLCAELNWLRAAYALEIEGSPAHEDVGASALLFFSANVAVCAVVVLHADWRGAKKID
jgi:phosphatidylinositol glycan class M